MASDLMSSLVTGNTFTSSIPSIITSFTSAIVTIITDIPCLIVNIVLAVISGILPGVNASITC